MNIKKEKFIVKSGSAKVYKITTNDDKMLIKKQIFRKPKEKYRREVDALRKLEKYGHYPKIVKEEAKKFTFFMTHCGDKINKKNIPKNWLDQINEIKKELEECHIVNGDLRDDHLLVLKGIISIIDFGNIRLKDETFFKKHNYDKYKQIQHNKLNTICECASKGRSSNGKLKHYKK